MKKDSDDTSLPPEDAGTGEMSEEEIDANLEGSFPASDPPAWTLGSDHPSETKQQSESDELKDE